MSGPLADVDTHLLRLLEADSADAFLIIEDAAAPSHFLQFTLVGDTFEMDLPLVTGDQQAREAAMWRLCEERHLSPRINHGSNGARFLDCYMPAVPRDAGAIVREAFTVVFDTPPEARALFRSYGLPDVAL